jgi:hypothetical protein
MDGFGLLRRVAWCGLIQIVQPVKVLPLPPPITIQTVAADDKNYETDSSLTLPAHTSSVQINYAAVSLSEPEAIRFRYKSQEISGLSLIIPERVKFRYRLEGLKQDWVDADIRRHAFFTNLAPGRYAFEVLAYNNDGVWSSTPAFGASLFCPHITRRYGSKRHCGQPPSCCCGCYISIA